MINSPAAIILSGGPRSVNDISALSYNKELFQLEIPILGICYGLQLIVKSHGGEIDSDGGGEYGLANIDIKKDSTFFMVLKALPESG